MLFLWFSLSLLCLDTISLPLVLSSHLCLGTISLSLVLYLFLWFSLSLSLVLSFSGSLFLWFSLSLFLSLMFRHYFSFSGSLSLLLWYSISLVPSLSFLLWFSFSPLCWDTISLSWVLYLPVSMINHSLYIFSLSFYFYGSFYAVWPDG